MSADRRNYILVVDDDGQIRRALRAALTAQGYVVELAATGEEALDIASTTPPAMVVLDLSMPGMDGIEVCRELRRWSNVPILVLSIHNEDEKKVCALDTGADDFLTKPFSVDELLARIRAHLRRMENVPAGAAVFTAENLTLDIPMRKVTLDGEELKLTRTEFAMLQYFLQNAGRVITYAQILGKIWGSDYKGDIQTLRVHIWNLRKKIERDPNRPRFIVTESGVGYRFAAAVQQKR